MGGHGLDDVLKVRDKWQCLIWEFHEIQLSGHSFSLELETPGYMAS